jgi:phage-related protein
MAVWRFFDYVELTKRNKIREWLDALPDGDRARIDSRLLMMAAIPSWSEKWVSKYRCQEELYEFRIKGKNVAYRPLGTYYGAKQYVILTGAIEKGDKIQKSDVDVALNRLSKLKRNNAHAVPHEFDSSDDMEKDEE